MSQGVRNVLVESDSQLAVQAINGNATFQLEISHSIDVCRSTLAVRKDICVRHVRRLANRGAHCMARIPCELNACVNVMIPPRKVLDSMMYNASFD